jgi:hypothetical protein
MDKKRYGTKQQDKKQIYFMNFAIRIIRLSELFEAKYHFNSKNIILYIAQKIIQSIKIRSRCIFWICCCVTALEIGYHYEFHIKLSRD